MQSNIQLQCEKLVCAFVEVPEALAEKPMINDINVCARNSTMLIVNATLQDY